MYLNFLPTYEKRTGTSYSNDHSEREEKRPRTQIFQGDGGRMSRQRPKLFPTLHISYASKIIGLPSICFWQKISSSVH
jgi:hypothetical protein